MEVRKALDTDDFSAIARIYTLSWKAAYRGIIPQKFLDSLDEVRWISGISEGHQNMMVMMDGKRYAGVSSFRDARDEMMAGWGEVVSIYLLPEYYGKGFGGALLDASVDALRAIGFEKVYLWVLKENIRARSFYQKQGFALSGEEKTIELAGADLEEVMYIKNFSGER